MVAVPSTSLFQKKSIFWFKMITQVPSLYLITLRRFVNKMDMTQCSLDLMFHLRMLPPQILSDIYCEVSFISLLLTSFALEALFFFFFLFCFFFYVSISTLKHNIDDDDIVNFHFPFKPWFLIISPYIKMMVV